MRYQEQWNSWNQEWDGICQGLGSGVKLGSDGELVFNTHKVSIMFGHSGELLYITVPTVQDCIMHGRVQYCLLYTNI